MIWESNGRLFECWVTGTFVKPGYADTYLAAVVVQLPRPYEELKWYFECGARVGIGLAGPGYDTPEEAMAAAELHLVTKALQGEGG